MKIFHTADVHLGAKFNSLGAKSNIQRKAIENSFELMVDMAIEQDASIYLIAGDLFDSPFPSENTKAFIIGQINKLIKERIYVALIAGNHDYLCSNSVYFSQSFKDLDQKYFKLFPSENFEVWNLEELNTYVIGASLDHPKNSLDLSKIDDTKLKEISDSKNKIGLFHGSIDLGLGAKNNVLDIKKLKSFNFDYIALGDWHNQLEVSKSPAIYYSGSPEFIANDQTNSGKFLLVNINDNKEVKVGSVKLSKREYKKIDFDLDSIKNYADLYEKIKSLSNKDLILEITLNGFKNLEMQIDEQDIKDSLGDQFFVLKIKDESKLKLTEQDIAKYSEKMVIGRFIKEVNESAKVNNYSQEIIDKALQLGIKQLSGEDK